MNLVFNPEMGAIALLFILGLYGLVRFFAAHTRTPGSEALVNWTPQEAVGITVAVYFISQLVAGLAIGIYGGARGYGDERLASELDSSALYQFIFILLVEAITIGLLYVFMKRRRTPWVAIGWVKPRWRDIPYAVGGFVAYFGLYALVVFNLLTALFPQVDTEQSQELGFDTTAVGPELLFIFVSLVILPPLVEEILVRGFMFTGLRTRMPVIVAALVASLVFAAAHLQWGSGKPLLWTAAADTFVLSMVLIWLRHKTGSLWPGIIVHFMKNGIAFTVLFIFKVA